jgi:hypothetical protein
VNKENIVTKMTFTKKNQSKNHMKVCKNQANQLKNKLELPLKLDFMNNPAVKPAYSNHTSRSKQKESKPQT